MSLTWKDTNIWKKLSTFTTEVANDVRVLLDNSSVMDKIEKILSKGSTPSKDFTLHDEEHSFRVAERMIEILPKETQETLSEYELMLMLLSAYLHDIGMTPELKKVDNHYRYLITDDKTLLDENEISEFQKWLDNENINKNIKTEKIEDIFKANELLTYYSRYKHNDWSEEWIQSNLSNVILDGYDRWQTDLIRICRSHHYGIDELKKEYFNPKLVGKVNCHRRLIAMCLRVADVMEIDPERTPQILFKHRNINNKSITYWLKDQEINVIIENGSISFYARPQKAFLHKAIEETIEQIEDELKLCNNLIIQKPLQHFGPKTIESYRWHLEFFSKDVEPFEDSFVYIKGSFRPNVSRVLELLGGKELYGDSFASIREMLQNSMDAIKESIAHKRLHHGWKDREYEELLGKDRRIQLSIKADKEGHWVVCNDNGVGMTREIIENYFLVSGSSQRHEISDLFRRCYEAGINFERTGQFGIGVLSYFMIGDKIIIKTKREQNTGYEDNDNLAWEFEINGLQDFGELRKTNFNQTGTEIRILIRKEQYLEGIDKYELSLNEYLNDTLIKIPCNIDYITSNGNKHFSSEIGWVRNEFFIINKSKKSEYPYLYSSSEETSMYDDIKDNKIIQIESQIDNADELISSNIRFLSIEGELNNNIGTFRVLVPYFIFDNELSFVFFRTDLLGNNLQTHHSNFIPGLYKFHNTEFSYNGIKLEQIYDDFAIRGNLINKYYCEVNYNSTISISVDRKKIISDYDEIAKHIDYVNNLCELRVLKEIEQNFKSKFSVSNILYFNKPELYNRIDNPYWIFNENGVPVLKEIDKPLLIFASNNYDHIINTEVVNNLFLKKVKINVPLVIAGSQLIEIGTRDLKLCFDKPMNAYVIADEITHTKPSHPLYLPATFPKKWTNILSYSFNDGPRGEFAITLINLKIKNSELLTDDSHKQFLDFEEYERNFSNDTQNKILSSSTLSLEFILKIITQYEKETWLQLIKKYKQFSEKLWHQCFETAEKMTCLESDMRAIHVSLNGWEYEESFDFSTLPVVDNEHFIEIEEYNTN